MRTIFKFAVLLIHLICGLCLAVVSYRAGRHRHWLVDESVLAVPLWLSYSVLVGLVYLAARCLGANRVGIRHIRNGFFCVFCVGVLSYNAGLAFWHRDYMMNRRLADQVVESIERYREAKGRYPDSLDEIDGLALPSLRDENGDIGHLHYSLGRLSYSYAGYRYDYVFAKDRWIEGD
jgi:hypothetical protein